MRCISVINPQDRGRAHALVEVFETLPAEALGQVAPQEERDAHPPADPARVDEVQFDELGAIPAKCCGVRVIL